MADRVEALAFLNETLKKACEIKNPDRPVWPCVKALRTMQKIVKEKPEKSIIRKDVNEILKRADETKNQLNVDDAFRHLFVDLTKCIGLFIRAMEEGVNANSEENNQVEQRQQNGADRVIKDEPLDDSEAVQADDLPGNPGQNAQFDKDALIRQFHENLAKAPSRNKRESEKYREDQKRRDEAVLLLPMDIPREEMAPIVKRSRKRTMRMVEYEQEYQMEHDRMLDSFEHGGNDYGDNWNDMEFALENDEEDRSQRQNGSKRGRADDETPSGSKALRRRCVTGRMNDVKEEVEEEQQGIAYEDPNNGSANLSIGYVKVKKVIAPAPDGLFHCLSCPKGFPTPKGLTRHEFQHRGDRCPICNMVVTPKWLDEHMSHHTVLQKVAADANVCPYPDCGVIRSKRGGMYQHLRESHGHKSFECEKCDEKFALREELLDHYRSNEGHREIKKRVRRRT